MIPDIFESLSELYASMDNAWNRAELQYGFRCTGCEENCCRSLFFHHTYIERDFFLYGFRLIDEHLQKIVLQAARDYCERTFAENTGEKSLKIMCPANMNGKCLVYEFRPMICRLHGIPHELHMPGAGLVRGDGCRAGGFDEKPYIRFDRTPFYRQMADIETRFRKRHGLQGRVRQTIAQMLTGPCQAVV